jgi:hypothetical protein
VNNANKKHTLNSLSGTCSAKRFARTSISSAGNRMIVEVFLRLSPGMFFSAVGAVGLGSSDSGAREGKKHLYNPSACHLLALVKFT